MSFFHFFSDNLQTFDICSFVNKRKKQKQIWKKKNSVLAQLLKKIIFESLILVDEQKVNQNE